MCGCRVDVTAGDHLSVGLAGRCAILFLDDHIPRHKTVDHLAAIQLHRRQVKAARGRSLFIAGLQVGDAARLPCGQCYRGHRALLAVIHLANLVDGKGSVIIRLRGVGRCVVIDLVAALIDLCAINAGRRHFSLLAADHNLVGVDVRRNLVLQHDPGTILRRGVGGRQVAHLSRHNRLQGQGGARRVVADCSLRIDRKYRPVILDAVIGALCVSAGGVSALIDNLAILQACRRTILLAHYHKVVAVNVGRRLPGQGRAKGSRIGAVLHLQIGRCQRLLRRDGDLRRGGRHLIVSR